MNGIQRKLLFYLLALIGLILFVLTIYDILYDKGLMNLLILSYVIVIFLILILSIFSIRQKPNIALSIEEFEKKLKGGLFHFKCSQCHGIFAVKKSRGNNNKSFTMTCPDCGTIGFVPKNPEVVEADIPEKKSLKANFKCNNCGEGVTIWAEGTVLFNGTNVYSCPFCGNTDPLKKF